MIAAFPHLAPLDWAGSNGFCIYGTGVDTQAIVDAQLQRYAKDNRIDYVVWGWYMPEEIYLRADSTILRPYLAHKNSIYKHIVRRTVYLQANQFFTPSDTGAYVSQYLAWLDIEFNDPGWYREDGRPVIYIYQPNTWVGASYLTTWNSTIKPWLVARNAYMIGLGGATDANVTSLGLHERVNYGPDGASMSGGANHRAWSDQFTQDQVLWAGTNGRNPGIGLTTAADMRARQGDLDGNNSPAWGYGTARWADPPRLAELYSAVGTALKLAPAPTTMKRRLLIYAGSEPTEGGPGHLLGTAQRGTSMLDGIGWGKNPATRPNTYTYGIDCNALSWSSTGTWTWTRTSGLTISGAFDSDEVRSSSTGATRTISHQATTRFILRGGKAVGYGHLDISLDGYYVTTIDCSAGSTLVDQLYWDSGVLTEGTHTLLITVVGDGTVAPDWVNVACNPQGFP